MSESKLQTIIKGVIVLVYFFLVHNECYSQHNSWSEENPITLKGNMGNENILPNLLQNSNSTYYKLDLNGFINSTKGAIPEFKYGLSATETLLPHSDDSFNSYKICGTYLMEPALVVKNSMIKT